MRELKEIANGITTISSRLDVWLDDNKDNEFVEDIDKKIVRDIIASFAMSSIMLKVVDTSMNAKRKIKEQHEEELKKNEEDKESDEKKDEPKEVLSMSFDGLLKILNGGA